jgi:hypothetical protein
MNRVEIEQAVLNEMHALPLDQVEATLKFVLSLKCGSKLINATFSSNQGKEASEGKRILGILQDTGYLGSMPDVPDLSENYKQYLDWDDKA